MTVGERATRAASSVDATQLREFSHDRSPQVRREVAANTWTPSDVLDELAGDRDWRVRAAVGLHPSTSDAGLSRLVDDPRWEVRLTMLDRPDLSTPVMLLVCSGDTRDARFVLAGQQRIPLQVAQRLAADPHWEVRRALAENTVFEEVRSVLRSDSRPVVRELAREYAYQSRYRPADPEHPPPDRREHTRPHVTAADLARWPTTPKKPATKWLKINGNYQPSQDEIPPHVIWLWRIAKAVDSDPAWAEWWSPSPAQVLELYPAPAGNGDRVDVRVGAKEVQVVGCSSALSDWIEVAFSGDDDQADRMYEEMPPTMRSHFLDLVYTMLTATGRQLDLGEPPPLPASVAQLSTGA